MPLNFDAGAIGSITSGKIMTITAMIDDSGQETKFSVLLNGMASGLDRMSVLGGTARPL